MALILLVRPWSLSPYIPPLRPSLLNTSTPSLLTHLHSLIPYTPPLHSLHTQIPLWVSPPYLHTSTPSLFTHLHSFTPCMHTSPLWGLPHSLHTSTSSLLTYLHSLTPYIPPLPHSLHTHIPLVGPPFLLTYLHFLRLKCQVPTRVGWIFFWAVRGLSICGLAHVWGLAHLAALAVTLYGDHRRWGGVW